jgi:hypothetical protein
LFCLDQPIRTPTGELRSGKGRILARFRTLRAAMAEPSLGFDISAMSVRLPLTGEDDERSHRARVGVTRSTAPGAAARLGHRKRTLQIQRLVREVRL